MKPLLEIRNISLSYHTVSGETKALSNISFDLMPGEFLAVVGPSGCGKSTLLNLICGMLPAEEGTILMNGIPPSPGDPRIGYMLQKDHLLEWRSIYRNILLGLEIRKEKTPEKLAYIEKMLDTYGLDKFRTARPSQLSGGMRQRALIAMGISADAELLLFDEPTKGLDEARIRLVADTLNELDGQTMVCVTHDLSFARDVANRIGVMYAANLIEVADADELYGMGLDEYIPAEDGASFIEWPQMAQEAMPEDALHVHIAYAEDGAARVATLEPGGAFDEARIDEIKRRLEADDEHPDD